MDRKEAIQTLSKVGKISVSYAGDLYDSFFPKPVVSQVVADWYIKFILMVVALLYALHTLSGKGKMINETFVKEDL